MTTTPDSFAPLGFTATFQRVVQVFGERWKVLALLALIGYMLTSCVHLLIVLSGIGNFISVQPVDIESIDELAVYLLESSVLDVVTALTQGASVWVVMHWYLHTENDSNDNNHNPTWKDAFAAGRQRWLSLVGCSLIFAGLYWIGAVPMAMGFFAAMMGDEDHMAAIYIEYYAGWLLTLFWSWALQIVTYVAYAAIMVEGHGPWDSMVRSFRLVQANWKEVTFVLLTWSFVKALLGFAISLLPASLSPLTISLDVILGYLFLAITPVFRSVIYISLRSRSEDEFGSDTLGEDMSGRGGEDAYITMSATSNSNDDKDNQQEGTLA